MISPSCELKFDTLGGEDEFTAAGAGVGLYDGSEGFGFEENDGVTGVYEEGVEVELGILLNDFGKIGFASNFCEAFSISFLLEKTDGRSAKRK